jgi:hypothetical protein
VRLAPRVQRTARAGRFEAGAHQAADAATRSAAAPPVSLNSALWPSSALVHSSSVVKKSFEELPFSCRIRCSETRTGSHEDPFTGVLTQAAVPVPICAQARAPLGFRPRLGVLGFFSGSGTVSRARLSDAGSPNPFAGDGTSTGLPALPVTVHGFTGTGAPSAGCGSAGSRALPLSPPP